MIYLGQNLRHLRKHQAKISQGELAKELGIGRGAIATYETNRAEPNIPLLIKMAQFFNTSIDALIHQDLSLLDSSTPSSPSDYITGQNLRVLAISTNQEEEENVELVPKKAAAGYTEGYADEKFINELPKYKLPFLSNERTYRAFEIVGDSMLPILPNSIVIGEYVLNFNEIKDGEICVVVTEDGVVLKKVYNRIATRNTLLLQSSNMLYESYEVEATSVKEIWKFTAYISKEIPETPSNDDDLRRAFDLLKMDVMELKSRLPA